jgi:hypothetical protein
MLAYGAVDKIAATIATRICTNLPDPVVGVDARCSWLAMAEASITEIQEAASH